MLPRWTIARMALLCLSLSAISPPHALAQQATVPQPGPGDSRIRVTPYDPDAVVALYGRLGYEMTIEFGADEQIETVSVGDSVSWQVTPNRKGTLLFLKPMAKSPDTSMTVATTRRLYSFILSTSPPRSVRESFDLLRLRFTYPEEEAAKLAAATAALPPPPPPPPPPPSPESLNFNYTFKGARTLYPKRVFDDGAATFFEFEPQGEAPVIFMIGPDGREEIAEIRIAGSYAIVDRTAAAFVLRYGRSRAEVRNGSWGAAERLRSAGGSAP